jgi:hypothetical protein
MLFLPFLFGVTNAALSLLPGGKAVPNFGLIGMGTISMLFFLGSAIHGFLIFRKMLRPETEQWSTFEGPALPVFTWMPGLSFWKCRLIAEPAAVFAAALFLNNMFILDASASHYLEFAALCLAVKNYLVWFAEWQYIREILDLQFIAPVIAKVTRNEETEEERAMLHIASLPNLPPDMRQQFVNNVARQYSPEG